MWLLLPAAALAQDGAAPPESRAVEVGVKPRDPPGNGFTFLGLATTKAVVTDMVSANPFLDGQVVGVLGGTNELTTDAGVRAGYVEQRLDAFFGYSPPILDGRATLWAAFEVDFGWGDRSYGIGGNTGGAFGADMVDLQTRRILGTYRLSKGHHDLSVHAGLQFVPDGPFDPQTARPDDLFRTSGRLLLFGSEAAGVAAYGRVGGLAGTRFRYRLGSFDLYESGLAKADDITLQVADLRFEPTWNTGVGGHVFWMRDRSGGAAGGSLGVGPTSPLSELQGGPRLDLRANPTGPAPSTNVDLLWLVADAGFNHRLDRGPVGLTGVAVANLGRMYVDGLPDRDIRGMLLDGEARVRWAPGGGSIARAELQWTSADDPKTPTYTGVMTANSWGLVGALQPTAGTLLLLPDPFSINRYTAVVYDLSNQGRGLFDVTGSVGWDPIPDRLTATLGGGYARDPHGPLGTEINANLVATAALFLKVGVHGAVVTGTELPADPWIAYLSLDWLVFP